MNYNTKSKSGFTIIEVVLVLAIAGLIFLIVFLAVPALQRSQRDTQRKSDLSRFMAQINSYQSNHRGDIPPATDAGIKGSTGFIEKYLTIANDTFTDPSGDTYESKITYGNGTPAVKGEIKYATNARCDGGTIIAGSSARQAAASIFLEGGEAYCQQN